MNDRDRALIEKLLNDGAIKRLMADFLTMRFEQTAALLSAARDEGRAEGPGDGFVVVPVDPTLEMLEIGTRCILGSSTIVCDDCVDLAQDMYRAMLSAYQIKPDPCPVDHAKYVGKCPACHARLPGLPASQTKEG